MKPTTQAKPKPRVSLQEVHARKQKRLAQEHRAHILRFLRVLKDSKHARYFLDQAHLDRLRLPSYPTLIQPDLDLGTIEEKLREGQYSPIKDLLDDFKRIVDHSRRRWGDSHRVTRSSKKLLLAVEAVVGRLESTTRAPNDNSSRRVTKPEQVPRCVPPPVVEQMLNSDQVKLLELAKDMMREAMPEAEAESLVTPPTSPKETYIKQKLENYRARRTMDQPRNPQNLVTEKIAEIAAKLVQSEDGGVSDDRDEGVNDLEGDGDNDGDEAEGEAEIEMIDETKTYAEYLPEMPQDPLTTDQIYALRDAKKLGPNFLGRTASLTPGARFKRSRKTNGLTTQDLLLPAAEINEGYEQHDALIDLTQAEVIYMTGHHLAWADLRRDELLSYSIDMLFLITHALGRYNRGQGGVTIQFLDRRKARTPEGVRTAFYPALDVYTTFKVPKWRGWQHQHKIKLHPRKFTHEYLSHGTVCHDDSTMKQASIENLIRDGLYEIFPPFQTPEGDKREGLYTVQVIYRTRGYWPRERWVREEHPPIYSYEGCPMVIAMSVELLQIVRKVTLNFCHVADESDPVDVEPPLHIFIGFLTFEKRRSADPVFVQWIKQHYKGNFFISA